MRYERYPTVYEKNDLSVFEFESLGPTGDSIRKRITFAKTEVNGVYNLAFGNLRENRSLDDEAISGDRDMVLATVVQAVDRYTTRYPRRWIYFCGSTPARTRLYRMVIGLNLAELSESFEILVSLSHPLFMKSKTKKKQSIWKPKVKFDVAKNLNALKAEDLAPEKLALANTHLKKMRSLPK